MPNYFLHRDGQNHGPYSEEQMKQLVTSGQVSQDELICPDGGSDWVAAWTLLASASPRLVTEAPTAVQSSAVNRALAITEQQVAVAYQKVKTPFLGIVFSAALPVILWAAKSDAEGGVRTTGKHRFLRELAKNNTDFLPIAIVIGVIGVAACAFWFSKSLKKAKALKAEFNRQQIG